MEYSVLLLTLMILLVLGFKSIATETEQYQEIIDAIRNEIKSIPIFLKDLNNEINIIPARHDEIQVEPGFKLMYLGKKLSF